MPKSKNNYPILIVEPNATGPGLLIDLPSKLNLAIRAMDKKAAWNHALHADDTRPTAIHTSSLS